MIRYAQTNIQLFNQLQSQGAPEPELQVLSAAYRLAMDLFGGQFRPNDKPFLAHLVGVASILSALNEPLPVVAAGLLHSAYSHGDFGDGTHKMTTKKRLRLQQCLGGEAESLVALYTEISWCSATISNMRQRIAELSQAERAALLIKLVDIREEFVDYGMSYSPGKFLHVPHHDIAGFEAVAVGTARALGYAQLAEELGESVRAARAFAPAECLQGSNSSVAPAPSWRRRLRKLPPPRVKAWVRRMARMS